MTPEAAGAAVPRANSGTDPLPADAEAWCTLDAELAAWHRAGQRPTLWWRDDDAGTPCPALERLLALASRRCVPVALAVIPVAADAALATLLARHPEACVLQHGFAHADHAGADEPGAELGAHRPAHEVLDDLARGAARLDALPGARRAPVLVPPWNRIDPGLLPALPALGFRGLSRFAPRPRRHGAGGLVLCNCHVDPVDWRAGGGFRGAARTLASLTGHLRDRREGRVDRDEPTGLMTHHWRHDAAAWDFLERVLDRLRGDDARWLDAREAFAP